MNGQATLQTKLSKKQGILFGILMLALLCILPSIGMSVISDIDNFVNLMKYAEYYGKLMLLWNILTPIINLVLFSIRNVGGIALMVLFVLWGSQKRRGSILPLIVALLIALYPLLSIVEAIIGNLLFAWVYSLDYYSFADVLKMLLQSVSQLLFYTVPFGLFAVSLLLGRLSRVFSIIAAACAMLGQGIATVSWLVSLIQTIWNLIVNNYSLVSPVIYFLNQFCMPFFMIGMLLFYAAIMLCGIFGIYRPIFGARKADTAPTADAENPEA